MARATIIAAPAEAASPERRRRDGSPVTALRISVHGALGAPPPPRTSPSGAVAPEGLSNTDSRQRFTSHATDSITARAMSPTSWSNDNPTTAPRAVSRHHGARAPPSQGRTITPRDPGGLDRARSTRTSTSGPAKRASQSTRDPAADSPPSRSQPPSAPRVTIITPGVPAGSLRTGTDTLAVVPHETIGQVSDEP